jgi:hypothetical protein
MSEYSKLYRSFNCCAQCGKPSVLFYCPAHNQARNKRERDKRQRMAREREQKLGR